MKSLPKTKSNSENKLIYSELNNLYKELLEIKELLLKLDLKLDIEKSIQNMKQISNSDS